MEPLVEPISVPDAETNNAKPNVDELFIPSSTPSTGRSSFSNANLIKPLNGIKLDDLQHRRIVVATGISKQDGTSI